MRRVLTVLTFAILASAVPHATSAQTLLAGFALSGGVHGIEEDWEVVIGTPDPASDGPQIMTYMSPVSDTSQPYSWFMLNIRDAPNPTAVGGLQIQVWSYADSLLTSSTWGTNKLSTTGEVIRWTQRIYYPGGGASATYEIKNGTSTTWGAFGSASGLGTVSFSIGSPTNLTSLLPNYNPGISAYYSKVGWQSNLVTSMTLKTVRQYKKDGTTILRTDSVNLAVDTTPQ